MEFFESDTYRNVQRVYESELVACGLFDLFGFIAENEGYIQIANIFYDTARKNRGQAEILLRLLNQGELPTTAQNLITSFTFENNKWTEMYLSYARVAREEGFIDVAEVLEGIFNISRFDDARFRRLSQNMEQDRVFCKRIEFIWNCLNCGNLYFGVCAPEECPVCKYPQNYYQLNCENY